MIKTNNKITNSMELEEENDNNKGQANQNQPQPQQKPIIKLDPKPLKC